MDPQPSAAAGFDSVTSYLSWEHGRLDTELTHACAAVEQGRFDEAIRDYDAFEAGLLRHARIEEELLFPVFEACSGIVGGPTAVMREEHRQVRKGLRLMRRGLESSDATGFQDGFRFLASVLPDHNAKEEHILYPTLDMLLRPAERTALVARLQRESQ
jgi:iron-sulfur cluster repair protein YtfE (RIC family)